MTEIGPIADDTACIDILTGILDHIENDDKNFIENLITICKTDVGGNVNFDLDTIEQFFKLELKYPEQADQIDRCLDYFNDVLDIDFNIDEDLLINNMIDFVLKTQDESSAEDMKFAKALAFGTGENVDLFSDD